MELLKKLGAKQILGNVKKLVKELCPNDGDSYVAYSIYGFTDGFVTGTSNYGEWLKFTGQVEAVNHVTGDQFAAMACFIPQPLQDIIHRALEDSDKVEFAFSVSVKRRDDLEVGYEYLVTPHKQAQEADPLEGLRGLIPDLREKKVEKKPSKPAPKKA